MDKQRIIAAYGDRWSHVEKWVDSKGWYEINYHTNANFRIPMDRQHRDGKLKLRPVSLREQPKAPEDVLFEHVEKVHNLASVVDAMEEYAAPLQSRITELEQDLNTANRRIDHYRSEVSKIRLFTSDSANDIGMPGQNIFEAIQVAIDELEQENKKYREALEKIAKETNHVEDSIIAEQALNPKDNG